MLGVLKFKKSLFAGILDGGEKDVFLGGSRLTKFMETVEKTTATIPKAEPSAEVQAQERARTAPVLAGAESDSPLVRLIQQGMGLLNGFSEALKTPADGNSFIVRDERSGETFLKLPRPEVLETALTALGDLLRGFAK